jgi:RNA polymerase sigma-70 factor, ECF subfamily
VPSVSLATVAAVAGTTPVAAERAAAMDERRFQEFYDRTARPLWIYAARISGNQSLADDVVQESYLRFLRADVSGHAETEWKSYLYRIATNLVTDHFRRAKFQAPVLADAPAEETMPREVERRRDFSRLFAGLNPRERSLLWLAYVEGSSHREIAAATGIQEPSVRPILFRARQKLAGLLRARGLGPAGRTESKS